MTQSNIFKSYPTDGFERNEYSINGVNTVVYSAGQGDTLVYFHGGGTFHGFEFARDWIKKYKVFLPFHPGFGESDDSPTIASIDDLVQHYNILFKQLQLETFNLVGISMGGWLASEYAVAHPEQVTKLVLAAPAGVLDPDVPLTDLQSIPPEQFFSYLVEDMGVLTLYLPKTDEDAKAFAADRMREAQSVGRIAPTGPFNPALEQHLPGLSIPILILWGKQDKILPVGLANKWMASLPNAKLDLIDGIGHLVFDESDKAKEIAINFLIN